MSLKSHEARKLAVAGAVAMSLFGAASASAASQTLQYDCKYPLIGSQPLSVAINASIPSTVAVSTGTGVFGITATATAGGDTGAAISLIGAASLEGSATASASIAAPGFDLPVDVPITVAKYNVPSNTKGNLVLTATGSTPSIKFPRAGYGTVDVSSLSLNLIARKADGTAITQLSKAQTVEASDTDPATFDVSCTLRSGQNTRLANIAITDTDGSVPGTNPGTPKVNATQAMPSTGTSVDYGYNLQGSASLKTLVKGSLPLTGSADASLKIATGAFSANLKLNRATGNLTALGFLPVQAKVDIVPQGPATGTLANGVLTAVAKVRIKLPTVTLAGIQLAGGSSCQAKNVTAITLRSTDKFFLPLEGGTLAGSFAISDLTNCGFLTGIVSPLTAGSGNAIALKLAPPVK